MEKGQREYFLRQQLKAIQEELGEGDPEQAELNELRERLAALTLPEEAAKSADRELARLERLPTAAAEYGDHPHLPRVDPDAAVEQVHRGRPRPRPRPQGARRRPLRPREGEGPDRRVPRGREAAQRDLGPDPLLRRPSRRRQDLARPVDCARARPQVRAHVGRRRPRRGRDPRPPAHLHRRDAGNDHPLATRRRVDEPGDPDRRDRQDGRRLPRRPGERDARGARSRSRTRPSATTTSTCRSTSRRCSSSAPRTRSTRFPGRCSTGWTRSRSPATPRTEKLGIAKRYLLRSSSPRTV